MLRKACAVNMSRNLTAASCKSRRFVSPSVICGDLECSYYKKTCRVFFFKLAGSSTLETQRKSLSSSSVGN